MLLWGNLVGEHVFGSYHNSDLHAFSQCLWKTAYVHYKLITIGISFIIPVREDYTVT